MLPIPDLHFVHFITRHMCFVKKKQQKKTFHNLKRRVLLLREQFNATCYQFINVHAILLQH